MPDAERHIAEDIETVLFTEDMLQRRIAEMGAAITPIRTRC